MRAYLELTKPRITWLILMSTGVGFWLGRAPGWSLWTLLHTLLGTGLLASGTAVLNQWYERDTDARMARTRNRPLPTGRVSPGGALVFGAALSAAGFVDLWLGAGRLAAVLGLLTLAMYLLLYTPLKRMHPVCTTVGALPGAMPPLIGFAAASGALDTRAWLLGAVLFLWQFPHFLSIAWMYREDYARGGLAMVSSEKAMGGQIVVSALLLVPVSAVLGWLGGGALPLSGALLLGSAYLWASWRMAVILTRARARQLLLASVAYLPLLYVFLLIDTR
jgi:protoheme IX farnesyltransferase